MRKADTEAIVVGAGLSGLAVAHELTRRGIDVRVLEARARVAEPWRARHPGLALNTHRILSGLPGAPMPGANGGFPTRDAIVAYLEDYADRFGSAIEYGVTVRRIEPARGGWQVAKSSGEYSVPHVVIATGHDAVPWMPDWSGRSSFRGELIHAADFGDAARFAGRDVLVVGAGNSGSDVLNHLVRVAPRRLWVSIRHGPVVFPKHLLGVPVQLLSPAFEQLPVPVVDRLLGLTQRLAFGDLARHGLRRHRTGGASRLVGEGIAPAIDDGFVAALKRGRIGIVADVASFDEGCVRLADGVELEPDVVIAATGYRTGLEAMVGHLGVLDGRGTPRRNGASSDPIYPGLWFTGMRPRLSGFFRGARRDGAGIASAVERSLRDRTGPAELVAGRPSSQEPAWT